GGDRRHLPLDLPWSRRRLAGGRPRAARSRTACLRAAAAAERQGDDCTCGNLAAAACDRGARVMDLLSRAKRPRRRAEPTQTFVETETGPQWPLNLWHSTAPPCPP